MEACGSAHYWARKLAGYGHEVKLIAAQFARPFVKGNKTDAADAQAIWEAAQRPGMKCVAVKSEGEQSVLMMHRMRTQLVKIRTMQTNQLRGLLYEFGADLPQGRQRGIECMPGELDRLESVLPAMVIETVLDQLKHIEALDKDIIGIEKNLALWKKDDKAARRLMEVPGVGLLTATPAVATIGDARAFKSGREFAAFVGSQRSASSFAMPLNVPVFTARVEFRLFFSGRAVSPAIPRTEPDDTEDCAEEMKAPVWGLYSDFSQRYGHRT